MIVRTSRNAYLVIGYKGQEGENETCLCENMSDRRRCLMIRIKDEALIRACVGFFYEQADSRTFTDFEECTTDEDSLLLIFSSPQGQPLTEMLGNEYSGLEERARIMENVLEKIIIQDMAPCFAVACLQPAAVWVKRNLEVSFLYSIAGAEQGKDLGMRKVQESLRRLLQTVFEEELKKETIPPMEAFLKRLEKEAFPDYMELYRQFREAEEKMLALPEEALMVPRTFLFRLWDRIKRLFGPLKTILALALLMVTLVYMIWTIQTASLPSASMELINQIGTLDIP